MANYFRITAYHPEMDCSVIIDSNGLVDKLWQFSADLIKRGFKIPEVGNEEKFLDGNFEKDAEISDKYILSANAKGKPTPTTFKVGNVEYHAIIVGEKDLYTRHNTNRISKAIARSSIKSSGLFMSALILYLRIICQ